MRRCAHRRHGSNNPRRRQRHPNIRCRRNKEGPREISRKTNNIGETAMTALILLRRIGQYFTDFAADIDEARLMAHRFKVLSRLTDAQLAEHGLKREDIPQAVLNYRARA